MKNIFSTFCPLTGPTLVWQPSYYLIDNGCYGLIWIVFGVEDALVSEKLHYAQRRRKLQKSEGAAIKIGLELLTSEMLTDEFLLWLVDTNLISTLLTYQALILHCIGRSTELQVSRRIKKSDFNHNTWLYFQNIVW